MRAVLKERAGLIDDVLPGQPKAEATALHSPVGDVAVLPLLLAT